MRRTYYVYILASRPNGTLYIGMTNNLVRRTWEHREGAVEGFTSKYGVKRLVHFETFDDAYSAATRERQLKRWRRAWKIRLVQESNPQWRGIGRELA